VFSGSAGVVRVFQYLHSSGGRWEVVTSEREIEGGRGENAECNLTNRRATQAAHVTVKLAFE